MPSLTSLEATLSQTAASISFEAKSEFGHFAESMQGANGSATDTGMAALLGMWATIFQQQVLPEPVAVKAGTAWQESGSSAVADTQITVASGKVEETSREGKSSPMLAANILGLAGGQAIQASILWQQIPEVVTARLPEPETAALARSQGSLLPVLPTLPFLGTMPVPAPKEGAVEAAPVVDTTEPLLSVSVAAPTLARKESNTEAPAVAALVAAIEPVPLPQKSKGLDSSPERVEGEKTIPVDSAPIPVASRVVPALEATPVETVVNLKRKVSERILAKTLAVEIQPATSDPKVEPIAELSKLESTPKADPLPELATRSGLPEAAAEAEAEVHEEPKLVPEQAIPEVAPRQESPAAKTAAEEPVQGPAPHSLEPAPRVATSAALPQAPPTAPAAKSSKASFVPEPPPGPPASREAKTISIRIPLNDSSAAMGAPVRHLDLIFNQRNNDLTLQFNSPNTEIQGRIEESMPTLLNKLQTENWTAVPAEIAANVAQPDLGFDGRRRAESLLPAANQFDSLREPIAATETASQGFNFDDSQADRKDAQGQSQQGRNRKKEREWQNEFDEQLEP